MIRTRLRHLLKVKTPHHPKVQSDFVFTDRQQDNDVLATEDGPLRFLLVIL